MAPQPRWREALPEEPEPSAAPSPTLGASQSHVALAPGNPVPSLAPSDACAGVQVPTLRYTGMITKE